METRQEIDWGRRNTAGRDASVWYSLGAENKSRARRHQSIFLSPYHVLRSRKSRLPFRRFSLASILYNFERKTVDIKSKRICFYDKTSETGMEYQPVVIAKHPRPSTSKHNSESRYWRQFKHPVFIKEYAPVTSVHFSPSKPHRYAVTSATRVQIYAPRTQKVTKTISRFKDVARSGSIRGDGKLVVAGDDTGLIQVSFSSLQAHAASNRLSHTTNHHLATNSEHVSHRFST